MDVSLRLLYLTFSRLLAVAPEASLRLAAVYLPGPRRLTYRADALAYVLAYVFAHIDIPVVNVTDHAGAGISGNLMEKAW